MVKTSLASLQKIHNFLSFYLINLKSSNKIASWHDAPYPIYKTQNKIKTKKYKDLQQDVQVLLWMLGLRFQALTFFCHSSQNFVPFSHEKQLGSQHIHQPNFSYLFFLHLLFWLSSRVSFLLKFFLSFLWNNVQHLKILVIFIFFNWMPSFFFHQFFFPPPPPLVQFVIARIMLGS